ncbi:MAG: iron ABC transporter substrate-binding protein, partial [Lentisphaerae bacterium]|nr:iron ABC transporter substrate-binding protein [Lentisphaerota bacterium]
DLAGRAVTLPAAVRRTVALGPGALRLLVYLQAADTVVGIEAMERNMARDPWLRPYAWVLNDAFLALPVVGAGGPGKLPDLEQVIACRPDVVIAVSLDPAQAGALQARTGVPVVCLSYGALGVWREEARASLALLGEILGRPERARVLNAYVDALRRTLEAGTRAARADAPSAYFGGISFKGAHGLTSTEAGYLPAVMANARNVADGLNRTGHLFVDREQILVWNPDVLFVDISCRASLEADYREHPGFYRLLAAVRNGRVYTLLPYNYYNTNIELALLNACCIARRLYPDAFGDLDLKRKAAEIFEVFLERQPGGAPPACGRVVFPENGPIQWEAP